MPHAPRSGRQAIWIAVLSLPLSPPPCLSQGALSTILPRSTLDASGSTLSAARTRAVLAALASPPGSSPWDPAVLATVPVPTLALPLCPRLATVLVCNASHPSSEPLEQFLLQRGDETQGAGLHTDVVPDLCVPTAARVFLNSGFHAGLL